MARRLGPSGSSGWPRRATTCGVRGPRSEPTWSYRETGTSGANAGLGRAALEPLLQALLILRNLLSGLAEHERPQELAEPVALEVELDRHPRAGAVADRLDGAMADHADRAVDPAKAEGPRRTVLRDLVGHRLLASPDLALSVALVPTFVGPSACALTSCPCHSL